jgi:hypothetical protein
MKVATYIDNKWIIDSIFKLYPHVSFSDVGVPDDFLKENNLYKTIEYINYDPIYKNLVNLETPKLINDLVYTVELVDKSEEEINNIKWQKIRNLRNSALQISDVYVLTDRWEKYDQATKDLWSNYRQSLRDLPINFIKPEDVVWPIKPV